MSIAFRSLHLALAVSVLPTLLGKVHAADWSSPITASSAYRATYYGDENRRALDGSYRDAPTRTGPRTRAADYGSDAAHRTSQADRYAVHGGEPAYGTSGWKDAVLPPAPIWSGLYLGVAAGAGVGQFDIGPAGIDHGGASLGGHFGYLKRLGMLGAGIEGDLGWSFLDESSSLGGGTMLRSGIDWMASLRARAGVDLGAAFVYATGGIGAARVSTSAVGPGFAFGAEETRAGLVWGGGVELPFSGRLHLRVEGLRYELADETYATAFGAVRAGGDITTVRAGLTMFLN
ncbi:MAG: porin family protein [Hyphomicrobiaceae bacterium]|nr:porin family protein [Hyphomicrobiaceae bacterium]